MQFVRFGFAPPDADDFVRQASSLEKVRKQQKYDGATSHRFILSVKTSPLDEQKGYLIASSPIWLKNNLANELHFHIFHRCSSKLHIQIGVDVVLGHWRWRLAHPDAAGGDLAESARLVRA